MAPHLDNRELGEPDVDFTVSDKVDLPSYKDGISSLCAFSAAVTHKMNNYLSGISLRVQVLPDLVRKADVPKSLSCIEAISRFVEEMNLLTAKLMKAAQNGTGVGSYVKPKKG